MDHFCLESFVSDRNLGLANVRRDVADYCSSHGATFTDNGAAVASMDDVSFWIEFSAGRRVPLTVARRELDDSCEETKKDIKDRIAMLSRAL